DDIVPSTSPADSADDPLLRILRDPALADLISDSECVDNCARNSQTVSEFLSCIAANCDPSWSAMNLPWLLLSFRDKGIGAATPEVDSELLLALDWMDQIRSMRNDRGDVLGAIESLRSFIESSEEWQDPVVRVWFVELRAAFMAQSIAVTEARHDPAVRASLFRNIHEMAQTGALENVLLSPLARVSLLSTAAQIVTPEEVGEFLGAVRAYTLLEDEVSEILAPSSSRQEISVTGPGRQFARCRRCGQNK
ncbi:MAG: hypothetical protein WBE26_11315, partial [Phycisphaerae bacterium]